MAFHLKTNAIDFKKGCLPGKKKKGKEWTENNLQSKLMSELRRRWLYHWEPRRQALNKRRVNGVGLYKCDKCNKLKDKSHIEVDHLISVQSDNWDDRITKLFAPVEAYQILCTECHKEKHKNATK